VYTACAGAASEQENAVHPPQVAGPAAAAKKEQEKSPQTNLPTGAAPVQVLVSLKDGKLVVKSMNMFKFSVGGMPDQGMPPGDRIIGGPGGIPGGIKIVQRPEPIVAHTYDLATVEVLDTAGKKVDTKELAKLLKEETVAMATLAGQP